MRVTAPLPALGLSAAHRGWRAVQAVSRRWNKAAEDVQVCISKSLCWHAHSAAPVWWRWCKPGVRSCCAGGDISAVLGPARRAQQAQEAQHIPERGPHAVRPAAQVPAVGDAGLCGGATWLGRGCAEASEQPDVRQRAALTCSRVCARCRPFPGRVINLRSCCADTLVPFDVDSFCV